MDKEYVIRTVLYLLPAILIMAVFTHAPAHLPADWPTHAGIIPMPAGYPPLAPQLTTFFFRVGWVGWWCIALFIAIPFCLLSLITKDERIPLAYVYLSGIPWILAWGGFFAEAVEQVWVLLNFITPFAWPFTFGLGLETHRESIGFWALSVVVYLVRAGQSFFKGFRLPYAEKRAG
jgi:hypothetical protein